MVAQGVLEEGMTLSSRLRRGQKKIDGCPTSPQRISQIEAAETMRITGVILAEE
jgi:hypothetical protein